MKKKTAVIATTALACMLVAIGCRKPNPRCIQLKGLTEYLNNSGTAAFAGEKGDTLRYSVYTWWTWDLPYYVDYCENYACGCYFNNLDSEFIFNHSDTGSSNSANVHDIYVDMHTSQISSNDMTEPWIGKVVLLAAYVDGVESLGTATFDTDGSFITKDFGDTIMLIRSGCPDCADTVEIVRGIGLTRFHIYDKCWYALIIDSDAGMD